MKTVTDNENVPSALSEQELQRLAEYFSILRDWSLQRDKLKDRDDDTSNPKATIPVDRTKAASRSERKEPSVTR